MRTRTRRTRSERIRRSRPTRAATRQPVSIKEGVALRAHSRVAADLYWHRFPMATDTLNASLRGSSISTAGQRPCVAQYSCAMYLAGHLRQNMRAILRMSSERSNSSFSRYSRTQDLNSALARIRFASRSAARTLSISGESHRDAFCSTRKSAQLRKKEKTIESYRRQLVLPSRIRTKNGLLYDLTATYPPTLAA
jgi:hypothetical protein